jgi:hypothetical protein
MIRYLAALALVATTCLSAASIGNAARAAAVCKSFKSGGLTYSSETLGSSWSCSAAKTWILKLSKDSIKHSSKNVPLKNGPHGLHCFATPNSVGGHATAGSCIAGTIAFPKTGFAWFT